MSPPRSARRLWLYGLGMLIPAAYFAWRYPLPGNTDQLLDIGKMARYERDEFVRFCTGVVALFALYGLAVLESRKLPARRALPAVFGCGALLALLFAWMYPVNAIDVFIYAVRSRLWTEYGENPNTAFPRAYWDSDPYMHFGMQQWADETSPYGPLWNLVAAPATLIGGDEIGMALAVFKILALVCVLGGGVAIASGVAAARQANAATGALVYVWNPLVLWEGVANAHNDVLLALLLLLALLAWARRWNGLVVPFLVAAALVKYVGLLLLPLAAVALWRRTRTWRERWQVGIESAALSLLVCTLAFAPFYDVRAVLDSLERQGEFIGTSPAGLAISRLSPRFTQPGLTDGVQAVGLGMLLLALGWLLVWLWLDPERLPRASFEVTFVLLLVATWWFRSWYLIWPAALAALLPIGWPFWRMLVWTCAGILVYGHYIWIWEFWGVEYRTIRDTGILFTFGPVVVVSLVELVLAIVPRPRNDEAARMRQTGPAAVADR